jgi:hypothetical protein
VIILLAMLVTVASLAQESSLLNEPAPEFDLLSLSGDRVNLADLRGRIIVLHFGAGW